MAAAVSRCYSPRTPKFNGALGIQYSFNSAMGSFTPRLDVQNQSKIYFTTNNQGEQDALTLLNGRLTWQSMSRAMGSCSLRRQPRPTRAISTAS